MLQKYWDRLIKVSCLLSFCVACDQTSKRIAEQTLKDSLMQSFFFDTFRLQYIQNSGAFLGFGSQFNESIKFWLFFVLPIILLLGASLLLLFSQKITNPQLVMIGLIVAGGLGNMIDRIAFGLVTDFLNIGIGSLRTGIFNIADLSVMIGGFGLLFLDLKIFQKKNP